VDLPARNADGHLITRPKVALDLHYLLTFYGDDTTLEPQRLLGLTVSGIHAKPILTREQIGATLIDAANAYLDGSDLAQEVELVKFTPMPLSLEELSKLWSVFFQTHYTLSIAYHATVVLLDGTKVPVNTLPARTRNYYTIPYYTIDVQGIANSDPSEAIQMDSVLSITGRGLQGENTKVRIAGQDLTPTSASDKELIVSLADLPAGTQRAGVQGLQVVHQMLMGSELSPTLHRAVESAVVPFVLRPNIDNDDDLDDNDDIAVDATDPDTITLTIPVKPRVGKTQRVRVLLNQMTDTDPASFSYSVNLHDLVGDDTDEITLTIKKEDTPEGNYLVRLQVDGAESPLYVNGSGVYSRPSVFLDPS
jgi:hypothetical protein